MIGLNNGIGQAGIVYPAPIDKERDIAAIGTVNRGWTDKASNLDVRSGMLIPGGDLGVGLGLDFQKGCTDLESMDGNDHVTKEVVAGGLEHHFAIGRNYEQLFNKACKENDLTMCLMVLWF